MSLSTKSDSGGPGVIDSVSKSAKSALESVSNTVAEGAKQVGSAAKPAADSIKNSYNSSSPATIVMSALILLLLYLYGVNIYVIILILVIIGCIVMNLPMSLIGLIIVSMLSAYYFHLNIFYIVTLVVAVFFIYNGYSPIKMVIIAVLIALIHHFFGNLGLPSQYVFPPVDQHDECPDNWMSIPNEQSSDGPKCHNHKNLPMNKDNPNCQSVMDFSDSQYLGEKGMENKKQWANNCEVPWGGVDNRHNDNN